MGVVYRDIDGEEVSAEWYTILSDMRKAGVHFNVNEGHRTMSRQQYFYDLWKSGRGNLAAAPTPNAPHIRSGRIDHAIDFSNDGAVFTWLAKKGLGPVRTVRGESWHIELPVSRMRAYHAAHGSSDPMLRLGHKGPSVVKLKRLLYSKGVRNFSGLRNSNRYIPYFGKYTQAAVRRYQINHGLKSDGVVGAGTWRSLRS